MSKVINLFPQPETTPPNTIRQNLSDLMKEIEQSNLDEPGEVIVLIKGKNGKVIYHYSKGPFEQLLSMFEIGKTLLMSSVREVNP